MPTARRPAHAPNDLDLLRDFANAPEAGSAAALEQWLAAHELGCAGLTDADVERAGTFRHAVRGLLAANAELGEPGTPLREFNATLDWLGAVPRLVSARRTGITTDTAGIRAALGRLAGVLLDAVNAGTFQRLKLCANPTCGRAFYDHGRNAAGRWCDMAVCGNRAKVAGYRSRRRTQTGPIEQPHSIDEALTRLAIREPRS
ncbi:CGNR zinc finger domain-containing protein [Dactylosporangium sp. NPDC048998]|uniref:CGNR zinc finger domain-containing protein n=1 Tax=Dactylosporangium sp. NPDC048998 TaxID=3363976 RepID=UPI00372198C6